MLHEEKTLPTPGSKYPPIQHAKRAALTATHGRQGCWGRGEASAPATICGGSRARPPPMPTEGEKITYNVALPPPTVQYGGRGSMI